MFDSFCPGQGAARSPLDNWESESPEKQHCKRWSSSALQDCTIYSIAIYSTAIYKLSNKRKLEGGGGQDRSQSTESLMMQSQQGFVDDHLPHCHLHWFKVDQHRDVGFWAWRRSLPRWIFLSFLCSLPCLVLYLTSALSRKKNAQLQEEEIEMGKIMIHDVDLVLPQTCSM